MQPILTRLPLLNLISNARDAMVRRATRSADDNHPPETNWRPRLQVRVDTEPRTDCIRISISDTGGGIEGEQALSRIFDPFYTTKAESGTGLGLSISQRIVQEHGGRLVVDNRPGDGVTFSMVLPTGSVG